MPEKQPPTAKVGAGQRQPTRPTEGRMGHPPASFGQPLPGWP